MDHMTVTVLGDSFIYYYTLPYSYTSLFKTVSAKEFITKEKKLAIVWGTPDYNTLTLSGWNSSRFTYTQVAQKVHESWVLQCINTSSINGQVATH